MVISIIRIVLVGMVLLSNEIVMLFDRLLVMIFELIMVLISMVVFSVLVVKCCERLNLFIFIDFVG